MAGANGDLSRKNLSNFTSTSRLHDLVLALGELNAATRADIVLDALNEEAIRALAETALNVILGVLPSDETQLRALRRHKEKLLELTSGKTSNVRRRTILSDDRGTLNSVLNVARDKL